MISSGFISCANGTLVQPTATTLRTQEGTRRYQSAIRCLCSVFAIHTPLHRRLPEYQVKQVRGPAFRIETTISLSLAPRQTGHNRILAKMRLKSLVGLLSVPDGHYCLPFSQSRQPCLDTPRPHPYTVSTCLARQGSEEQGDSWIVVAPVCE